MNGEAALSPPRSWDPFVGSSVATRAEASAEARPSLSRERVLRAAVKVADEEGIDALTMRRLGRELGSEAMSLYYHVAKKDDVLDGIAELVLTEINEVVDRLDVPSQGADWKKATRQRILSAREVLLRHKWAPAVFESRENTSLAVLRYYDGLLRLMRDGGFSWDLCHHAMHALGSRALRRDRAAGRDPAAAGRRAAQPGRHDGRGRARRPGLHHRLVRRPDRVRVRPRRGPGRPRPAARQVSLINDTTIDCLTA
jgi:AcrR family transcriptional regulator